MADETENPVLITADDRAPTIQILNVIPQKVIQVDKPTGYYKNKKKIKIFIY